MGRDTTPISCALIACLTRASMCLLARGFQFLVGRVPAFPLCSAGMTCICFGVQLEASRRAEDVARPALRVKRPVFSLDVKAAVRTAKESWHVGAMSWAIAPVSQRQWEQQPVALESVSMEFC